MKENELIKEMKEYRDGMVVRNLPFQWISDIITKWEMKKVKTTSEQLQNELERDEKERAKIDPKLLLEEFEKDGR